MVKLIQHNYYMEVLVQNNNDIGVIKLFIHLSPVLHHYTCGMSLSEIRVVSASHYSD